MGMNRWHESCFLVAQEVPMLDTTTNRQAKRSALTTPDTSPEQLVVEQIMQPFMGNRDWAQLISPRVAEPPSEQPLAAGELAVGADECWLPDPAFATMAFLSGMC